MTARNIVLPRDSSLRTDAAVALAAIAERAFPDSPSGGYAPAKVDCPSTRPTLRKAGSLSSQEKAWLEKRRNQTIEPMIAFLNRANISGFDATSYINKVSGNASQLPNIGIGVSGGGYRALLNGGGFLAAADNRTINSTNAGQIGGLLQATTYLAGLSGGSWLVGSIFNNNFSSVQTLLNGSPGSAVWRFDRSILKGPESDGISIVNTADYFIDLEKQVAAKQKAGFNASITDYWGRGLSYQLINATDGGPAYTWSSIADTPNFANGLTPMPLVVSDGRVPGTTVVSLNSTNFEFNPWELGSWDPTAYAFAPLKYIGSKFSGGILPTDEKCVEGFDQSGYIMGTSSTLFNEFLLNLNDTSIPTFFRNAISDVLKDISSDDNDVAQYQPNPFYLFNNETKIAKSTQLDLTDGGEDGQNIPLNPMIQPQRAVDVIFAIDSSADTDNNWPNGESLMYTYERSLSSSIQNGTAFPAIPDVNTFLNEGLNTRPTFFGCDASNMTGEAPLIVYIPNAPYTYNSNYSTFDLTYNITERNAILENGYNVATMGNGTLDSQWPTCVACAVLSRSFTKTKTSVPDVCTTCFNRYCWNGTTNSSTPANYTPTYKLEASTSGGLRTTVVAGYGSMIVFWTAMVAAVLIL